MFDYPTEKTREYEEAYEKLENQFLNRIDRDSLKKEEEYAARHLKNLQKQYDRYNRRKKRKKNRSYGSTITKQFNFNIRKKYH